jgi:MinD-like ATPase involved in chromosome partitioning or flagellar assembly
MARVMTFTSGKGGVGKTNISVNLALYLASLGYRTCLFDADLGLANVNILLGLYPENTLEDVIFDKKSMVDILIRNYRGIDIIPGSSGIERMADLESDLVDHIINSFSELNDYDYFLFDTSAGISRNVVSFCMASSEIILVITPEPTSLTDGYSLLKILSLNGFSDSVMVVVNQSKNIENAKTVYSKFKKAVQKYLPIKLLPLGTIIQDSHVVEAVKSQKPFISLYPNSNASKCIKLIAMNVVKNEVPDMETNGLQGFWRKCFKLLQSPLQLSGGKTERKGENSEYTKPKKQEIQPLDTEGEKLLSRDTAEISFSTEQDCDSEIIEKGHQSHETHMVLSRILDSVSSISEDLRAIRGVMENGNGAKPDVKTLSEGQIIHDLTEYLNGEKYLKR